MWRYFSCPDLSLGPTVYCSQAFLFCRCHPNVKQAVSGSGRSWHATCCHLSWILSSILDFPFLKVAPSVCSSSSTSVPTWRLTTAISGLLYMWLALGSIWTVPSCCSRQVWQPQGLLLGGQEMVVMVWAASPSVLLSGVLVKELIHSQHHLDEKGERFHLFLSKA